eukprot:Pgem_evm1s10470
MSQPTLQDALKAELAKEENKTCADCATKGDLFTTCFINCLTHPFSFHSVFGYGYGYSYGYVKSNSVLRNWKLL